jgi:hypothetical protein
MAIPHTQTQLGSLLPFGTSKWHLMSLSTLKIGIYNKYEAQLFYLGCGIQIQGELCLSACTKLADKVPNSSSSQKDLLVNYFQNIFLLKMNIS